MNDLTPEIYDASRDPRVLELRKILLPNGAIDYSSRYEAAAPLYVEGILIDIIDIAGLDPVLEMNRRLVYGFTYYPNAFQPLPTITWSGNTGSSNFDPNNPPSGAIKSSLQAADYPAFATVPVPLPNPGRVGALIGNGIYAITSLNAVQVNGQFLGEGTPDIAPDGVHVFFHLGGSIMGPSPYWETLPARQERIAKFGR